MTIKVLIGLGLGALLSFFLAFGPAMATAVFIRRLFFVGPHLGFARLTQIDDIAAHGAQDGAIILAGTTMASKSSSVMPRATASTRNVVPFLCAFLATLAARS